MKSITIFFLAAVIFFAACSSEDEGVRPQLKDLTEAVYASGKVYPKSEYKVFANADGFITDMFVAAGDTVNKGQPLFKIESDIQDVRSRSSYEIYQTARKNYSEGSPVLKEIEAAMSTARAKMQNDSLNYVRFKNLLKENATSRAEFERAELAYQVSKNEYERLKSSYQRTKDQLYVELQNAEAQYKVSAKDESNYAVKSFMSGMVYDTYKEQGEAVHRSEPLALIGSANEMYLQLTVDELDIANVQLGQEVLVTIDLYGKKVYKARVTKVYPKLNPADQSFRVDAEMIGEKPATFYGLNVEANIIIAQKENVLTIPREYLLEGDSVLVQQDGETHKKAVTVGAANYDLVQIMDGLDTNSVVVRP